MDATGSWLRVPDECCLSWLGILVGTRAHLDGFCWFDLGWPAHHTYGGVKLPLSCTYVTLNATSYYYIHIYVLASYLLDNQVKVLRYVVN